MVVITKIHSASRLTYPFSLLCPETYLGTTNYASIEFYVSEYARSLPIVGVSVEPYLPGREEELSPARGGYGKLFLTTYRRGVDSERMDAYFQKLKKCSEFLEDLYWRTRERR